MANALLFDGLGGEPFQGGLAIREGRIAAVGDISGWSAPETINLDGLCLAPGFIDVHTHDDLAVLNDSAMEPKVTQGVTTVIVGNCGISLAPYENPTELVPPLGLLGVRTGTRWSLPGPRAEAEQGRVLAAPWVPLVLAAAEAWRQTEAAAAEDATQARALVARVRAAAAGIRDVEVLGDPDDRLPHVVTFSVLLADGEALVDELARRGLAVASGSACTSSVLRPSHVLAAMGVLTHGNVRVVLPLASVSPGREADVERLRAELTDAVRTVRRRMGTEDL
ncbi:MAG: aminotransferase class V-fold PLP-dependent enzyme [Micrococcales bacterium]|nr:aminotransferase class V-fold PLP-dependent enzyme [Micrococcales bacterium]